MQALPQHLQSPQLEDALRQLIVDVCDLQEADPSELGLDDPMIGPDSPWELDSLDSIEVIMAVQQHYEVHIDSQNTGRQVLRSLRVLATFIRDTNPTAQSSQDNPQATEAPAKQKT